MAICYFHIDTDGHSSAALIRLYREPSLYCIPINYGWELQRDKIQKDETVYVVDFAFDLEDMRWLNDNTNLIWIDHHGTSIDLLLPIIGNEMAGIRDTNYSGVELTWQYLFSDKDYPKAVALIGAYDLFKLDQMPDVVEFNRGLTQYNTFPSHKNPGVFDFWKKVFEDPAFVTEIVQRGSDIWQREQQQNKITMKSRSFEAKFEGYNALIANVGLVDSLMFTSVIDPNIHDLLIGFYYHNRGYWKVSVREVPGKPVTNVGKLCMKYNGGGHPGAGGFSVSKLSELSFMRGK